jgi:hypothetical protein
LSGHLERVLSDTIQVITDGDAMTRSLATSFNAEVAEVDTQQEQDTADRIVNDPQIRSASVADNGNVIDTPTPGNEIRVRESRILPDQMDLELPPQMPGETDDQYRH